MGRVLTCPNCGAPLTLALPQGGEGPRKFNCSECDRPDPLKTDRVMGWLKGELQPPK
jgi:primosomal protein N'